MRLVLEQKSWSELEAAEAASAPLPHIAIHPSAPWDDERAERRREVVEWNLPAGATVKVIGEERCVSMVDWPLRLVEARVMKGGEVVEARWIAFYGMLELMAAAMWRGSPAELESRRDKIRKALVSGRPDWRTREIVALAQLYE
jgi:hypothetical protein